MDELLWIAAEAQKEFSTCFELIDLINRFMDLLIQTLNVLLQGCGHQEVVHLPLDRVVDFNFNIVNGRRLFRCIVWTLHLDHVIDHHRIGREKECTKSMWELTELEARAAKNLLQILVQVDPFPFVSILQGKKENYNFSIY